MGRRSAGECGSGFRPAFGDEAVSNPGLRLDVLAAGFTFELFAELSDEDAEVLRLVGGLASPDGGQERAMGDDLAGVASEMEQEVEFFRGEVNGLTLHRNGMGGHIDDEVARFDGGGGAFRRAAEVGAHAGHEFLDAEGLGHVVVGAGVEGFDLGALVIAYGEHDDRGGGLSTDSAAYLDAAHTRHHEIGDDEVRGPFAEDVNALFGVVGYAHVEALSGERGAEDASDLGFVVDNEDAAGHGVSVSLHHPTWRYDAGKRIL